MGSDQHGRAPSSSRSCATVVCWGAIAGGPISRFLDRYPYSSFSVGVGGLAKTRAIAAEVALRFSLCWPFGNLAEHFDSLVNVAHFAMGNSRSTFRAQHPATN